MRDYYLTSVINTLPQVTELEPETARLWNDNGTIRVTEWGSENTYYVNEFEQRFYCKNHPSLFGVIRHSWEK